MPYADREKHNEWQRRYRERNREKLRASQRGRVLTEPQKARKRERARQRLAAALNAEYARAAWLAWQAQQVRRAMEAQ